MSGITRILAGDSGVPEQDMTTVAMHMLVDRIESTDDPLLATGPLVALGACILRRLGFDLPGPADVSIQIGTDDHPDEARIVLAWPLPPEPEEADQ